ncbi:hypothetical protein SBOR_7121 [Sclerotinia borealis F-4128]|uniref:Integral membrane protein n=1 Tax=Sclerotinia borealis (strain F-4128) TaxID=1432307 RepID=W9C9H5_SCLBF|nr:hypothetical protein SBOR_7121 [Sclerotinia borealis F-4128]
MQSRRQLVNEDSNILTTTTGTELPTISAPGSRRGSLGPSTTTRTSATSLAQQNTLNNQSPSESRQSQRPPPAIWRPSIRIRRLSSSGNLPGGTPQINQPYDNTSWRDWEINNNSTPHFDNHPPSADVTIDTSNRRRSSSEPQRPAWLNSQAATTAGPPRVREGSYIPGTIEEACVTKQEGPTFAQIHPGGNNMANEVPIPLQRSHTQSEAIPNVQGEYDTDLVDFLDLVDPEISTLTSLTNIQNSLFIPSLGNLFNRNPTYNLTRNDLARRPTNDLSRRPTNLTEIPIAEDPEPQGESKQTFPRPERPRPRPQRQDTGAFTLTESISHPDEEVPHYAIVPEGINLEGWSPADKEELNDHVRHLLHSRREGFKRNMKGFGQYVRKPLGFFVTLYAVLITLFGLAWVLFLIGWVNVGSKRLYVINIIDNVLVALFAIMGDGLAPFRVIDTYHMIFIAHYHHLTWRLRKENALPKLEDHNDLPAILPEDIEDQIVEDEVSVLNPAQQKKLQHHQKKFNRSHTFYKPHETTTHHAFPLRLLVAIVVLLDCHSLLQIALGTCTWAISYKTRPFALTTVILCCSITVNITAGVLISVGDHRTRKKDVLEKMFKQDLTKEAIHKMEKMREKEKERNGEQEAENQAEVDIISEGRETTEKERKREDFEIEDGNGNGQSETTTTTEASSSKEL